MGSELLDELRDRWSKKGVLKAAEDALSKIGFDDAYLKSVSQSGATRTKVVKDGTWGMVEVEESSLRLLDSPLVQRMRAIHQLGFSYLTYPSAEHSRFAHSLGMHGVVTRFLEEIVRRPRPTTSPAAAYSDWRPDKKQIALAAHAAILHDIGHMPFSHVTEGIMHSEPKAFTCGPITVDDFLLDPQYLLGADDEVPATMKLAELLSVAFVLTDRFDRFYRTHVSPDATATDTSRIASLILGLEPDDGLGGLANLISGSAIDADKIDYINRDARACGIAVGIDVSRLFLRSRFLEVKPGELQRLRSLPEPPENAEVVFVVNASGLDSIEEVGQARTMLYHRVYLHQTTRNAERLLAKALQTNLEAKRSSADADATMCDAFSIWTHDDFGLLGHLVGSTNPTVSSLANRLKARALPKRASAFGRRFTRLSLSTSSVFPRMTPKDAHDLAKQVIGTGLDEFRSNALYGKAQSALEEEVRVEAGRLAKLLRKGRHNAPKGLPGVVSILPMPSIEENRIDCFILDNEQLSLTSSSSVSDEQMEASDIMKSTGYVLADTEWRDLVFLAARTVFYRRKLDQHQVMLKPYPGLQYEVKSASRILLDHKSVLQRVRVTSDDLSKLINQATSVGYFDDYPRLAPVVLPRSSIDAAATHLAGFQGQGNWSVSPESVTLFLSQFPTVLRPEVLKLIRAFLVFDRTKLSDHIDAGVRSISMRAGQSGFITGLSPDSGGSVRMIVEHERKDALLSIGWEFKKTIRDVFREAKPGDHLVLCEDNVTSGQQAICQLMAWLDVPESKWTPEQKRERGIERTPLDARDVDLLKSLDLTIVVAAGSPAAQASVGHAFAALGLDQFQGLKFGEELALPRARLSADLRAFLEKVGTSILAWSRHQKDDPSKLSGTERAACKADALGSGGAEAVACSSVNVPAGTIPAFWAPGFFKGEPWVPLLIRRGYLDRLVIV